MCTNCAWYYCKTNLMILISTNRIHSTRPILLHYNYYHNEVRSIITKMISAVRPFYIVAMFLGAYRIPDYENIKNTLTDTKSEDTNHGYIVLINLCDKIISELSKEPKALAYTLLGKGFLSHEKVEEIVQIPATNKQNARKIYDVVLGVVQHFPHRYNDFTSVLEEKAVVYRDLLTSLKEAYLPLGKFCHILDNLTEL